ncbi:amino acid permease-domain-containing protein [Lineolata rhizophorae]|uniref:Amino acid permease-domain-containing protein n=1 Tax=Lineolata rhizophorae TaxID=578093 RepID=A0A6A6NZY0_9PEZI|nr:amino acid permease-domain-containing protein [Lineolata rhizophorae]
MASDFTPTRNDSDSDVIFDEDEDPSAIHTSTPDERFRLGLYDIMGLVINRMIGTGIFMTPTRVMQGTMSTGITLLFWFAGVFYAFAGTHLYIEYGLNVPRRIFDGLEQGVPRSGGDLNYLQYIYTWPRYRKNAVLFSTCLYGIAFIVLGNMAGNCINFAQRVLQASNVNEPSKGAVRGIALAAATFSCFIHAFSRRGGISLNNILAIMKVCILLLIVIAAIIFGSGGFKNSQVQTTQNLDAQNSFDGASSEANGYAHAFLAIIFAFSGFEQPNYVLGEVSRPHRKFPIGMTAAVGLVCALYIAVNISYMVVVQRDDQIRANVAQQFFELTFGSLSADSHTGGRVFNAFLAISSLGNIIVMTYTAARVKQEIAKEGILPWPKFWAKNSDISLGRLLRWARRTPSVFRVFHVVLKMRWLAPEEHSEKTPVGALLLHFLSCVVLLFTTYGLTPGNAYNLLTGLASYSLFAFFGVFLALGILYLRLRPSLLWKEKSPGFSPILSVICASVYLVGNLFPLIGTWIKPAGRFGDLIAGGFNTETLDWYIMPTVGWCCIALGALWWLGFLVYAKRVEKRTGTVFTVERVPEFERDPPDTGRPVQLHETVYLAWVAKENEKSGASSDDRTPMMDFV